MEGNKITKSKRSLFIPFGAVVIILTLLIVLIMTGCSTIADYISKVGVEADTSVDEPEESSSEDPVSEPDVEGDTNVDEPEEYSIPDYVSDVSMDADTSLGDLEEYSVLVILPMGTFEEETRVTLTEVKKEDYSNPDESRFELAMSPTDISLEDADYTRTGEPVSVTFKLDEEFLSEIEDESFVQVAYYFDGEWYLQPVKSVDLNNGIVEAEIYHFSMFAPAKLTKKEIQGQKAAQLAIEQFERENNTKVVAEINNTYLKKIISESTGVKDTAVLEAIVSSIANENDYTSLMISADKGDLNGFSTKMAETIAKSLKNAAKIGDNAGMIAGAFQAIGFAYEGDTEDAAKAMSDALLDSNAFGKMAKATIAVGEATISTWKKNGIEEMYQAYKNGADEGWFGFNVGKEDFGGVYSQSSGGIKRQIDLDAVKSYCKINGVKEGKLSPEKLDEIKADAIKKLEEQFKTRLSQEGEIAVNQEYYEKLFEIFEEKEVDFKAGMDKSFKGLTYEQRLQRYYTVAQNIIDMTGKKLTFNDSYGNDEIPVHKLAAAIILWYHDPPKVDAMAYLREEGLLPVVEIDSLAGNWSGTMTVTEVYIDEEWLNKYYEDLVAVLNEMQFEECDEIDSEGGFTDWIAEQKALVGTSADISAVIRVIDETTVGLKWMGEEESDLILAYDKNSGNLTLTKGGFDNENFTYTIDLSASNADAPTITGVLTMASIASPIKEELSAPAGLIKYTYSVVLVKGS